MYIDLDAVSSNVRQLKAFIGEKVHLMAVVKANAYGHGMLEIARTALSSGATWLGVASLDEALILRRQLSKDIHILVLGYVPPQHLQLASQFGITVTGISLQWVQEANRIVQEPINIHLKIDTGLNRVGCKTIEEVLAVLKIVSLNPNLNVSGVFTHFATSDDLNNRTYFLWQLARFNEFLEIIPNRTEKIIHCANSDAILYQVEKPFFNMVRSGKALMGPPDPALEHLLPFHMQTAMSLHSTIGLVKQLNASENIGYGGTYTTTDTEWIGTVPIGYADGWHQNFKATGVLVEGKRFPIIGRISMDQLMIRLDQKYPVGTRVTFIGQQGKETITVNDVAQYANVPMQEVFCSLTSRVPRIYKQNVSIISGENAFFKSFNLKQTVLKFKTNERK
ncbi:unnamed protein product [Rotaria sp. Silwood1]|nr:unnamed protein product [Rotaria sp. Silwood1]